jgi:hypothetical protein
MATAIVEEGRLRVEKTVIPRELERAREGSATDGSAVAGDPVS